MPLFGSYPDRFSGVKNFQKIQGRSTQEKAQSVRFVHFVHPDRKTKSSFRLGDLRNSPASLEDLLALAPATCLRELMQLRS